MFLTTGTTSIGITSSGSSRPTITNIKSYYRWAIKQLENQQHNISFNVSIWTTSYSKKSFHWFWFDPSATSCLVKSFTQFYGDPMSSWQGLLTWWTEGQVSLSPNLWITQNFGHAYQRSPLIPQNLVSVTKALCNWLEHIK